MISDARRRTVIRQCVESAGCVTCWPVCRPSRLASPPAISSTASAGSLLRMMSRECGVACSTICWMRPRSSMKTMSSGMYVFFIHMLMGLGLSCTKSMPRMSGSERTNMRPCAWRLGLSASQTSKVCFTFLPSLISSLPRGNAARSSSGPVWASACVPPASVIAAARNTTRRRRKSGFRWERMAVIVVEFDPACKVEAGEQHALALREARGGAEAESARLDAIDGVIRRQGFHALLGQRVHRALVIAQCREQALFALEEDRDVRGKRLSILAFLDAADAEDQSDAMPVASVRPADADADAVALVVLAGWTRTAFALHLCIFPIEVQVHRAAHARPQIAGAAGEAAGLFRGFGRRVCRWRGAGAMRKRHAERSDTCCDRCAMKHACTVARALYC